MQFITIYKFACLNFQIILILLFYIQLHNDLDFFTMSSFSSLNDTLFYRLYTKSSESFPLLNWTNNLQVNEDGIPSYPNQQLGISVFSDLPEMIKRVVDYSNKKSKSIKTRSYAVYTHVQFMEKRKGFRGFCI